MNSYEEIDSIHKSTIIRCLKKDLNFSYKRLERRPAPATTPEAVRKTLEGALVQQKLEERKIELIFMDEFSVNTSRDEFFGWGKKGWKRYIKTDSNDFSMSFIWALSSRWVYGIFGWNGSITSDEIKYYVKCLATVLPPYRDLVQLYCDLVQLYRDLVQSYRDLVHPIAT